MTTDGLGPNNDIHTGGMNPLEHAHGSEASSSAPSLSPQDQRTQSAVGKLSLGTQRSGSAETHKSRSWNVLNSSEIDHLMETYVMKDPGKLTSREKSVLSNAGKLLKKDKTSWETAKDACDSQVESCAKTLEKAKGKIEELRAGLTPADTKKEEQLNKLEALCGKLDSISKEYQKLSDAIKDSSPPNLQSLIDFQNKADSLVKEFADNLRSIAKDSDNSDIKQLCVQMGSISSLHTMTKMGLDLPSSKELKDLGDMIRLSSKNRPLNSKLFNLSKSDDLDRMEKSGASEFAKLSKLTASLDRYEKLSDKITNLQERAAKGEEIPEKDKLTPYEAHALDSLRSSKGLIEKFNGLMGREHDDINALNNVSKAIDTKLQGLNFEHWRGASVIFEDLEAEYPYFGHDDFMHNLQVSAYKTFTGAATGHASMVYEHDVEGQEKPLLRESHVVGSYYHNNISNEKIGMASYRSAYKVNMSGLVSNPEAKAVLVKELGSDWEAKMETLWKEENNKLQQEIVQKSDDYRRSNPGENIIENSAMRRIKAAIGPRYKLEGTDHTQMRDLPEDRKVMFCSEFTALSMIIVANRVNDRLMDEISKNIMKDATGSNDKAIQQRFNAIEDAGSLCRFPVTSKTKLSKLTPALLQEKFSRDSRKGTRTQVLEKIEHPPEIKNLFQC